MYRVIKSDDSRLQENLNGKYSLVYFSCDNSVSISAVDVIFFNFNEELRRNIEGNNYFTSDGYLYDGFNISGIFRYVPQVLNETQIIEVDHLRNLNLKFYDVNENNIVCNNWVMILKKLDG